MKEIYGRLLPPCKDPQEEATVKVGTARWGSDKGNNMWTVNLFQGSSGREAKV